MSLVPDSVPNHTYVDSLEVKMYRFLAYLLALLLLVSSELEAHRLYTRENASGEGQ